MEIQRNWYDLLSPSMNPTILPLLSFSLVYKINQILSKDFHFPERDKGYILDNTEFARNGQLHDEYKDLQQGGFPIRNPKRVW